MVRIACLYWQKSPNRVAILIHQGKSQCTGSVQAGNQVDISILRPAHHLSTKATRELNRIQPLSKKLVQELELSMRLAWVNVVSISQPHAPAQAPSPFATNKFWRQYQWTWTFVVRSVDDGSKGACTQTCFGLNSTGLHGHHMLEPISLSLERCLNLECWHLRWFH